jgi:signal transduction histidine kinase
MRGTMSNIHLGLLFAIFAPFAIASWVASRRLRKNEALMPEDVVEIRPISLRFEAVTLDVESAVRGAADAVHTLARELGVRIELAVMPRTKVRVDPTALRVALEAAMRIAIRATPSGQVLVTATILGGQLHIRIVDDGTNTDQLSREGLVRETEVLISLQGGSIAVETRPGQGTAVTIRLPRPIEVSAEINEPENLSSLADQTV